jgi:hypothetical protein
MSAMKIVICAGHAPDTAGKRSPDGSLREFHFNSRVADILKDHLLKYEGVEIRFSHEPNRDVPLKERTNQANAWGADLYFSIHANAYGSGWNDANGIETYAYTSKPKEAMILAAEIQNQLIRETGRSNRGVKTADFHVLRETSMTAVLAECGFMTNREEAELLKSESYRQKCAKAMEMAIVKVYKLVKKVQQAPGTPIISEPSATVEQAQEWSRNNRAPQEFIDLAPAYWLIAQERAGADPALAYVQFGHETGFLYRDGKSMAGLDASYHNPCGLKITTGGSDTDRNAHKRFTNWGEGITAQVDHLALYAGAPGYPKSDTPDPRHFTFIKGTAKTVEALGGKWAPSKSYGSKLVSMLKELRETKAPTQSKDMLRLIQQNADLTKENTELKIQLQKAISERDKALKIIERVRSLIKEEEVK